MLLLLFLQFCSCQRLSLHIFLFSWLSVKPQPAMQCSSTQEGTPTCWVA